MKDEFIFFKKNDDDQIWWVDNKDKVGEHLFSFDKNKVYNLFRDYPYNLTKEEKEIFDKENPYWADFFKDRNGICYDYIPYKKIGSINLEKSSIENFVPSGIKGLYENELNHVLCRPIALDHLNEKISIKINDNKIEITSDFKEIIEKLKDICNDLVIENDDSFINAYSKELGIIIAAQLIEGKELIHSLRFVGKDVFDKCINIIHEKY